MIKQSLFACAVLALLNDPALAASGTNETGKEAKPVAAPTASALLTAEAPPAASPAETKPADKRKTKWSNPNLDLSYCLDKENNTAVIKCVE